MSARRQCFYQKIHSQEVKINESGSRVHDDGLHVATSLICGISAHIRSYKGGIFDSPLLQKYIGQADKFSHSVLNTCQNFSIFFVRLFIFLYCLLLLFVCFFWWGEG